LLTENFFVIFGCSVIVCFEALILLYIPNGKSLNKEFCG